MEAWRIELMNGEHPGLGDRVAKGVGLSDADQRLISDIFGAEFLRKERLVPVVKADRVVKQEAAMLIDQRFKLIKSANPELSNSKAYEKALHAEAGEYETANFRGMTAEEVVDSAPISEGVMKERLAGWEARESTGPVPASSSSSFSSGLTPEELAAYQKATAEDRASYGRVF